MRTYVCCGVPPASALCADGRETYLQEMGWQHKSIVFQLYFGFLGKTYTCNPLDYPTTCPAGYDCAFSNVRSISVCCRRDAPVTPPGPYEPTGGGGGGVVLPTPPPVTFRPPVGEISCPIGWSELFEKIGYLFYNEHFRCVSGLTRSPSLLSGLAGYELSAGLFLCAILR